MGGQNMTIKKPCFEIIIFKILLDKNLINNDEYKKALIKINTAA